MNSTSASLPMKCRSTWICRERSTRSDHSRDSMRTRVFELEPFLDQWLGVLKEWEITDCSYDDFVKLCDKPVCKA